MKTLAITLLLWMGTLLAVAQPPAVGDLPQDIRVHDPVLMQQDSVYYLFCTGRGIGRYRSTDLQNWERLPGIFEAAPAWVLDKIPAFGNHIWAPDVAFYQGRYLLFYSVSEFGKNNSCIGLVTTASLHPEDAAYGWTDHGAVICSEPGSDDWNAIDPNFILDEAGNPWLSFGSFWGGIQLFPLKEDLSGPLPGKEMVTIAARERSEPDNIHPPGDGAIEAPFIVYRAGWYFLFVSFDYCCRGEESTYHLRVGRSREVAGPYHDREGQALVEGGGDLLLAGDARWAALGHNAVVRIGDTDYLLCHGYDRKEEGRPKLIMRPLQWDEDFWPLVP